MRRWLSLLLAASMLVTMLSVGLTVPVTVSAETTEDGFAYEIVDGTATITDYTGTATEVVIPDTIDGYAVTEIGTGAFENCSSLTSVTIPDGVTHIGEFAFLYCENLTSVIIPNSVTRISAGAFGHCTSLSSITLPDSVTSMGNIGGIPFYNTAYFNDSANWENGALYIGNHLVEIDREVEIGDFSVRDGTVTLCYGLFSRNETLLSITIPDSVKGIGYYAFANCKNLSSVTLGNGVSEIAWNVFGGCENLSSITIPDGVTSIGQDAFANCSLLTSITIPDSVSCIEPGAFSGCDSLADVYYSGSKTEWDLIEYNNYDWHPSLHNATIHYNWAPVKVVTITDSKTAVSVSALDGVIAEGVELVVDLMSQDENATQYDITLVEGGVTVQPQGEVEVSLPVPDGMNGSRCKIYRIEEDGNKTDMNEVLRGDKLIFVTDHFSVYIIEEGDEPLKGDLNGDGKVTIMDAVMLYYHVNGKTPLSDESGADMNADGKINISDAVTVYYFVNGKIDRL